MKDCNVAKLDFRNFYIAQLRISQPFQKIAIQDLGRLALFGYHGLQENCAHLAKCWVPDALIPHGCRIEVLCSIPLNNLHPVFGIRDRPWLPILANGAPALSIADPALVDEHFVAPLVSHPEANQLCVPNDFIWFHGIDN